MPEHLASEHGVDAKSGAFELAGVELRTVVLRNIERRRREEQRLRGYARALERANADLERARRKAERTLCYQGLMSL